MEKVVQTALRYWSMIIRAMFVLQRSGAATLQIHHILVKIASKNVSILKLPKKYVVVPTAPLPYCPKNLVLQAIFSD